jgi:hypothetical protein
MSPLGHDVPRLLEQLDVDEPPPPLEADESELICTEGRAAARDRHPGPVTIERDGSPIDLRCRGRGAIQWLTAGARGTARHQRFGCGAMGDHFGQQDVGGQSVPVVVRQVEVEGPERPMDFRSSRVRLSRVLLCRRGARRRDQ